MTPEITHRKHCLACKSTRSKPGWTERARLANHPAERVNRYDQVETQILECGDCGFGWVRDIPADKEYFNQFYNTSFHPERHFQRSERDPIFSEVIHHMRRKKSHGGKLLDVGALTGRFMTQAQHAGFETTGLELGQASVAFCREKLELNVQHGDIATAKLPADFYDFVVFIDCLEHLLAPDIALEKALASLRPGGWIVVKVPHFPAQKWKQRTLNRLGLDSRGIMINFQHLNHFKPKSLTGLLEQTGFKDVEFYPVCSERIAGAGLPLAIRNHAAQLANFGTRALEKLTKKPLGLHLLALARKPRTQRTC